MFLKTKRGVYLYHRARGKSHPIAFKESGYTTQEYEKYRKELDGALNSIRKKAFLDEIIDDKNSTIAASKANVSVDEVYEWYFKGKDGDEEHVKFYEIFHKVYVRPAVNAIQDALDNNKSHLDFLLKRNKNQFTKKDVAIWIRHGLVDNEILVNLDNHNDEDDEEKDTESKLNANEMLREMGVKDYDKISVRKSSNSSTILSQNDVDVEELKRQILKK